VLARLGDKAFKHGKKIIRKTLIDHSKLVLRSFVNEYKVRDERLKAA